MALCSTASQCIFRVIGRSSMTMKAHTYYIIFGRPPIGGGRSFPPSPLAAPLPTACCVVVDAACLYAVSTSSACRRALMSLRCQRSLHRSSVPHAASRTACRCAGIPPDRRCAHARSPRTSALGRPCTWPRSVPDRRAHTAPSTPSPSYTSRSLRATHLQTCTHSCVCVCVYDVQWRITH